MKYRRKKETWKEGGKGGRKAGQPKKVVNSKNRK